MALVQSIGSTNGALQTTIVTGTLTAAPTTGQIIVVVITQGGNGSGVMTPPSGFAAVPGTSLLTSTTNGFFCSAFYKVAGGSETTTYTFTSPTSNWMASQTFVHSGRNTTSPFTAAAGTTGGAASASPLSIALTGVTAGGGDDLIYIGATYYGTTSAVSFTQPSTPTGFGSDVTTQFTTSGFTPALMSAVNQGIVAGATGTITGTATYSGGGNRDWVGYVISIAEAAAGAGNIVQQTNAWSFGDTLACPTFGRSVVAGDAIALVGYLFPVALAISSSPVVSDGTANVYNLAEILLGPAHTWPITFTALPTGTAGTLTANFGGATGTTATIVFSDGEIRRASVTNGNTAVSWTTALTGTPTVNAIAYDNNAGFAMWYAQNSVAGTVTPQFSCSLGGIQALYAAEITNVARNGVYLGSIGNVQSGPGTSPNAINSGTLTINQTGVIFGFCTDVSTVTTTNAIAGGTGFNAQSMVWNSGSFLTAIAEDATINSSTAATFTAGTSRGTDSFYTLAMGLAGPGPFTPFTQTQFFVTDTIVQQ